MSDVIELVLALVGLVVGIVLMIAQFQLFAIRRLLETLVQQMQTFVQQGRPEGASTQPLPVPRHIVANLPPLTPAQQKQNRVLAVIIVTAAIVGGGFLIFFIASNAK